MTTKKSIENNIIVQLFNGTTPQYHFYVQDHLGNNRVVCNASGTIEQVNHYYPFGGLFGESANDEVQRYKYNGKELDRMHGLNWYDYHARQYDGAMGQFTSMDQLCEKYYNVSPYAYCAGNPVMYVDPDGRDWYQNNTTQYYTWFNCEEELKGFTHIGEKGSLLGEFESKINNILTDIYNNKDGLYSEGHAIDITNPDKGCILPSDYKRMNNFLDEFVFGYGPEISILTDNHPYTKELKTDDKVIEGQQLLRSEKTEIAGQLTEVKRQWGVLDVLSTPSLAKQYVGSYSFDSYTAKDGKHLLNVIYDTKNAQSLFYHIPGTGYLNHARNSIIKPLSTTYQFYIWKSKK